MLCLLYLNFPHRNIRLKIHVNKANISYKKVCIYVALEDDTYISNNRHV